MPLFSIPLSGLTASSNALSVISNNLANLNTIGFKDQQANFKDLFYQTLGTTGSGDPMQLGAGSAVGSVSSNFTNGNVNNTGVPTDVAITGSGFFVTEEPNGAFQFTRAGNFTVDSMGQLKTADGQSVMGYPAVNGVINAAQGLIPIQLGQGQISPPVPTTTAQLGTNLDATAAVGSTPFSSPLTVYDSLGNSHVLTFQFTKTAANAWDYQITIPAADIAGATAPVVVNTGSLAFNGAGQLVSTFTGPGGTGVATTPAANIAGITIAGLADGANNLTFSWNLLDANGAPTLSQEASPSTTSTTIQNGYGSGTLQNFTIDSNGIVQGSFSNGQTQAIAQIALANFANNQGLQLDGGNSYTSTLASGPPVIGTANTGGRGSLSGGALELSNVDISQEFTQLIVTQRGFEANARVVTTFDQITQDTINLKSGA
ncbi:MAG: flagellar hook protein FlgE [Terriglobales bacterium]